MLNHELVARHGSVAAAARAVGITRQSMQDRLRTESKRANLGRQIVASLPDVDEPVEDLIARRAAYARRAATRRAAETWLPLEVPEAGPFGVMWFGDPHLDDDFCDWDTLLQHVELCKTVSGIYGASIGDATNNWVGRLMRLYADQNMTKGDARRVAKWFLKDCGVNWLLWLIGNHDEWNEGEAILGLIADGATYLPSWEARIELRAGGERWRVHCAHDFKGSSIWNPTHGPLRKAMMTGGLAELYVCGHRHTWAQQCVELEERGGVAHAVRVRGYKRHDHHAVVNGFPQGRVGAAVLTIFDPTASSPAGRVLTFADPVAGVKVLQAMRAAAGLDAAPAAPRSKRNGTKKAKTRHVDRSKRPARRGKKSSG